MNQFLASYIMRGRMQAMMVASTMALLSLLIPPLSLVSSSSVALVSLRRGAQEGLYVLLASALAAAVLGYLVMHDFRFALGYGLLLWLPVWVIAIVLRESRRLHWALELPVILGALGVIGVYLFSASPAAIWQEMITSVLQPMLESPGTPVAEVHEAVARIARYMTGMLVAGAISGMLLSLLLARWWQSLLYNPGGFRQEYLALTTDSWLAATTLGLTLAAWWLSGRAAEIAWNLLILLGVLYSFVGTAIVHGLLARRQTQRWWLPVFYVLLFAIPQLLMPVALIGLVDPWLKWRERFSNPPTGAA